MRILYSLNMPGIYRTTRKLNNARIFSDNPVTHCMTYTVAATQLQFKTQQECDIG